MSRFTIFDGRIQHDDQNGLLSAEEVTALALLEMRVTLQEIANHLGTIAHVLENNDVKVHITT